jgi:hypothetical protein
MTEAEGQLVWDDTGMIGGLEQIAGQRMLCINTDGMSLMVFGLDRDTVKALEGKQGRVTVRVDDPDSTS